MFLRLVESLNPDEPGMLIMTTTTKKSSNGVTLEPADASTDEVAQAWSKEVECRLASLLDGSAELLDESDVIAESARRRAVRVAADPTRFNVRPKGR
jgi:hypothetical protein